MHCAGWIGGKGPVSYTHLDVYKRQVGSSGGLRIAWHVVADVVFHEFGHQAVDGDAGGGKTLQNVGARLLLIQSAKNAFQLSDNLLGAINEV